MKATFLLLIHGLRTVPLLLRTTPLLFLTTLMLSQNADINILKQINLNRNKNLDPAFQFISNSTAPLSIAAPILVYTEGLIKKDSVLRTKGLFMAESELVSAAASEILKYVVKRPRPFITYPFIEKESSAGSYSFPSGHASDAFSAATSLSIAFPRWYVVTPAYIWAGVVAYSRMDLGVHYPSDVIAGALVGSGCTLLCHYLNGKLRVLTFKP